MSIYRFSRWFKTGPTSRDLYRFEISYNPPQPGEPFEWPQYRIRRDADGEDAPWTTQGVQVVPPGMAPQIDDLKTKIIEDFARQHNFEPEDY